MKRAARRSAFTLVELLVVIGIISVLISILLPTLSTAREAANRAVCLNHLRQIHLGIMMYANENKDYAALGTYDYWDNRNYVVWWSDHFFQLGITYPKYIRDPRILYCPSETDPSFQYNTPQNGWRVGDKNPANNNPGGGLVAAGYGTRPRAPYIEEPAPSFLSPGERALGGRFLYNGFAFYYPTSTGLEASTLAYDWNHRRWLPKLGRYKSRAIVSDLFTDATFLTTRHKKGINVLYSNGAAKWVPRSAFDKDYGDAGAGVPPNGKSDLMVDIVVDAVPYDDFGPPFNRIWLLALDKQ